MALQTIPLSAGLVRDDTDVAAEGGWVDADRVRFVRGRPQTIGGWSRRFVTPVSGVCRALFGWEDRQRSKRLAIGTHSHLYVAQSGDVTDITPSGLAPGSIVAGAGGGFGLGLYGTGAYGQSAAGSLFQRIWSLDAWGDYLLASPRGGTLYLWTGSGLAAAVAGAPAVMESFFVDDNRYVVALGATEQGTGQRNPMTVRWSDQDDYTAWTAGATNKAGEQQLTHGGRIVGGRAGSPSLIWTDTALYQMRLLDADLVFGFPRVAVGCGLIGAQAAALRDGRAFWMSTSRQFFGYAGGAPEPLVCPIADEVFDNLVVDQADQIVAGVNSRFNEVWWFYPDARDGGLENTRYCAFNWVDRTWTKGQLARTAWLDAGVFSGPIAAAPDGMVYDHETGASADGAALGEWIESGAIDVGDGDVLMRIDALYPDLRNLVGVAQASVKFRDAPAAVERTVGPFSISPATQRIAFQSQGRHARIRIAGASAPSFWRLGEPRWDVKPTGMRL